MATRAQKTKLTIFLIGTALLFMVIITALTGGALWESRETYYVRSETTVVGLEEGSPVMVEGVRVGRVTEVRLDRQDVSSVRVALAVEQGVRVPRNAMAYFRMQGVTGQRIIDIADGTAEAGVLPPGGTIPRGTTALEELEMQAPAIAEQTMQLTRRSEELVSGLVELTESIEPERVRALFGDAEELMRRLNAASEQLDATIRESRAGLQRAIPAVSDSAERMAEVLEGADVATAELGEVIRAAGAVVRGNEDDVRNAVQSLRSATQQLEELARELRLRPSRLFFSRPPQERELP